MPRASRKKATRSRSRGRSLLMGGTGRKRRGGVSKTRRGRGLFGDLTSMLGLGRRRRTRGKSTPRKRGHGFIDLGRDLIKLATSPVSVAMMKASGRRRTRGGSLFADFVNNTKNGLVPGRGRRRYSRRTRGGAMKTKTRAAPAQAAAQIAAVAPAKSGSRVKTALKGLAGLATALGAAYLGNKAYQIKNRQDVNLSQIGQRAQLPKSPYSYGYQFDMRNSNV
jgi:hypothetical protein